MEQSQLFKIFQAMPKGAITHIHSTSAVSPDFLIKLTRQENFWLDAEAPMIKYSHVKPSEKYTEIIKLRADKGN